ncbi:MAG: butyrate kinase [Lachnospiraceae bacterium]|nr:butyrate kinase [Lachnospiraceae bacterium]
MAIKSLIINPGSTSTKIAVFEDETMLFDKTLRHTTEEISQYDTIFDQKEFRKNIILDFLKEQNFDIATLDMVVGRGGLVKPIPGGTYRVSDALMEDLKIGPQGQHASNLGGVLAREIADSIGKPSFIVDPVAVDELQPIARVSGMPEIERNSIFHPLNQKAMARRYAKENGKKYEDINVIVAHMGGGVSVGAHRKGQVVDVSNALEGDGAFSPERAGGLPVGPLLRLCFSGKYTEKELYKKLVGGGGFNAYLGTNDMQEVTKMAETDEKAKLLFDAFVYQVSKDIGARAATLKGEVDAIILTGGIAYGNKVTDGIKDYVGWIAPVVVYPGEDELLALAQGGLRVLNGEEEAKEY